MTGECLTRGEVSNETPEASNKVRKVSNQPRKVCNQLWKVCNQRGGLQRNHRSVQQSPASVQPTTESVQPTTASPNNPNCLWIFSQRIKIQVITKTESVVTFVNGTSITVNASKLQSTLSTNRTTDCIHC